MANMAEIECPNCQARYQVPSEALGPTGRDVTCSSCGNIWHATPIAEDKPIEAGVLGTQTRAPDRREKMEELRRKLEQVQGEGKRPDYGGHGYVTAEDNYSRRWGESGEATVDRRGEVHEAVFGDNYEDDEFERTESALRDRMSGGGQSARMKTMRGGKGSEAAGARGRLMNKHRKHARAYAERKKRNSGGGGTGFWFVALVAGGLFGLYALSDQIVARMPEAEPAMQDYVAVVDQLRVSIRDTFGGLTGGGDGEG